MIDSSRMPAIRNIPPYSSVSRIRMVGRSQGRTRARAGPRSASEAPAGGAGVAAIAAQIR